MRLLPLFIFIVLAGCQTTDKLAKCKGPAYGLNSEHWEPTRQDLKACRAKSLGQPRGPHHGRF